MGRFVVRAGRGVRRVSAAALCDFYSREQPRARGSGDRKRGDEPYGLAGHERRGLVRGIGHLAALYFECGLSGHYGIRHDIACLDAFGLVIADRIVHFGRTGRRDDDRFRPSGTVLEPAGQCHVP